MLHSPFKVGGQQDLIVRLGQAAGAIEQLCHVYVFGGEPGAQHVVGVGHDLEAGAAHIGVGGAGVQIHGLTRLERHHVQQERREETDIARVLGGQAGDQRKGLVILTGGGIGQQASQGLFLARAVQDQHLVEEVLQASLIL
ncbi:hypothetical protein D3C86_1042890 [compost metagenome]